MLYYSFNTYLKERYNERVQKIALDAGMTCPNRDDRKGKTGCIYCDADGSGNNAYTRYPDIRSQALDAMAFLGKRYKARKFMVYFQSFSNTYASLEDLEPLYAAATDLPGVVGLAVATRPDCLTPEVLELLAGYSERLEIWLELGLQTVHDDTLKRINRAHTYADFLAGYTLARSYPLRICLHVIIGLPGEEAAHVHATAREVARLEPDGLKIHSLYIHKKTALETLYNQGGYRPLEQAEYVGLACDFLEMIPTGTIIQRLTGDPTPSELVAPAWSLNKQKTLSMIENELLKRGGSQGAKHV